MFCPQCGAKISDSANHCPQCGHAVSPAAPSGTTPPPPAASPQDYMTMNIILLVLSVCCCGSVPSIVTGVLGVVFSSQARGHIKAGHWAEAEASAKSAKTMALVTGILLVVSAIVGAIILFLYGAAIFASVGSMFIPSF